VAGQPIDISTPLVDGMAHWPGDPTPRVTRYADLERGDACTLTALAISAHTGTHVDAPRHYLEHGATLDEMPLGALLGRARVIEITDERRVTAEALAGRRIRRGDRVLLRTRASCPGAPGPPAAADGAALTPEAASWLVARDVVCVGIDTLSVDPADSSAAHRILLEAGVWIIEGLLLEGVAAGVYELICLPLRLAGAEGAPARALLLPPRRRRSRH
jgi:arylformamidase